MSISVSVDHPRLQCRETSIVLNDPRPRETPDGCDAVVPGSFVEWHHRLVAIAAGLWFKGQS